MADTRQRLELAEARWPVDGAAVRALFTEYAEFMGYELCFQGFAQELEDLPGDYAPPAGTLILACVGGRPAGCVAVRPAVRGHAELCRLFVRPRHRGDGIGRALVRRAIDWAARSGYACIDLETVPTRMATAERLYARFGFAPAACAPATDPAVACYSLALDDRDRTVASPQEPGGSRSRPGRY